MEKRSSKRSTVAFLCACVWALIVLCLSMPVHHAEKAHAATMDDEITIWASDTFNPEGGMAGEFEWAKLYVGIGILTNPSWKDNSHSESTVTVQIEGDKYSLGNLDGSPLYQRLHTHDFTTGTGLGNWEYTGRGHFAECSECDLKFEVAHRLQADGTCKDCGTKPEGDYANQYTFTNIPEKVEWTPESGASFTIDFDVKIFVGFTLKLNLSCNCALKTENGAEISYSIDISGTSGVGSSFNSGQLSNQTVWSFKAGDYVNGDSMRAENVGQITITLSGTSDGTFAYSGNFSDTLTFSVELIDSTEGY